MPEFPKPNPDFSQEQALTMILSSIALEELALSHIINAEGEKIQYILNQTNCTECPNDFKDILAVNKSVTSMLDAVLQNQMILKNKMEKVLEYLPMPPCPPKPPHPPELPCPPEPPRPPGCAPADCSHNQVFDIIPGMYKCNEPLRLKKIDICGCFAPVLGDCVKIQLPCKEKFVIDLYLDDARTTCPGGIDFIICREGKSPIIERLYPKRCDAGCYMHNRAVVETPDCCPCCYASFIVCSKNGMNIRQGKIFITRL